MSATPLMSAKETISQQSADYLSTSLIHQLASVSKSLIQGGANYIATSVSQHATPLTSSARSVRAPTSKTSQQSTATTTLITDSLEFVSSPVNKFKRRRTGEQQQRKWLRYALPPPLLCRSQEDTDSRRPACESLE
ncbi:hypothetical protein ACF0H5_009081 [Mactra antiquata]